MLLLAHLTLTHSFERKDFLLSNHRNIVIPTWLHGGNALYTQTGGIQGHTTRFTSIADSDTNVHPSGTTGWIFAFPLAV